MYIKKLFFIVELLLFIPCYSMHNKVLQLVKGATAGALIGVGLGGAYKLNSNLKKEEVHGKPMPLVVCDWIKKELNSTNYVRIDPHLIPLFYGEMGSSWCCLKDKAIRCGSDDIANLEIALSRKKKLEDRLMNQKNKVQEDNRKIEEAREMIDWYNQKIAHSRWSLMHELKHLNEQDSLKRAYMLGIMPIVTQTGFSTMNYCVKKMLKITPPKTWFSVMIRSLHL